MQTSAKPEKTEKTEKSVDIFKTIYVDTSSRFRKLSSFKTQKAKI